MVRWCARGMGVGAVTLGCCCCCCCGRWPRTRSKDGKGFGLWWLGGCHRVRTAETIELIDGRVARTAVSGSTTRLSSVPMLPSRSKDLLTFGPRMELHLTAT